MKILFINSVCGIGSTGRICTDLAKEYEKQGHEVKIVRNWFSPSCDESLCLDLEHGCIVRAWGCISVLVSLFPVVCMSWLEAVVWQEELVSHY